MITHNIPAFYNVPVSIPHKDRLVVTGEGIIHQDDFERIKGEISGAFAKAAVDCFDFAMLPDFGEKMSRSIRGWFHNGET